MSTTLFRSPGLSMFLSEPVEKAYCNFFNVNELNVSPVGIEPTWLGLQPSASPMIAKVTWNIVFTCLNQFHTEITPNYFIITWIGNFTLKLLSAINPIVKIKLLTFAPRLGLEPRSLTLTGCRSTLELTRRNVGGTNETRTRNTDVTGRHFTIKTMVPLK